MIEFEHSPLGGSGADRWFNCAGSFLLHRALAEAGELEIIESDYAKLGTAAHELGALCLESEREPYELVGWKIGDYKVGEPDGINPDAVSIYVTECESLWRRDGKDKVLIEKTIHLPEVHSLLKGTVDFGLYRPGVVLHGRDYKNGEGIGVTAPNNRQMLYYGFLQALYYNLEATEPRNLPVTLGIVQPNFYGIFEAPDVWETTLGVVLDWGHDELLPRMHELDRMRDIDATDFVLGEHCQFCPVLMECPKMQKAFQDYAEGTEFLEMLTNEELDRYYAQLPYARKFMNALGDVVKARLLGGGSIPSGKLVEKKTARVWRMGAEPALKEAFGPAAMKPPEIKSPAQIEKLSSQGKALALEWGYKPEANGLSLAPITDPRPAAKPPSNADVFAEHEQSPAEAGF